MLSARRGALGAAVFLAALFPWAPPARATGNDQPYTVGEVAALMGGAGVAIVHDGSSPYYNPGGLGRVSAEGISANANVYGVQTERSRRFVELGGGLTGDLQGENVVSFPSSIGYVKPLDGHVADQRLQHAVAIAVVIPDHVKRDGLLELPAHDVGIQFHAKERLLAQTYWILPGWGGCLGGTLCLGLSLPITYRTSEGVYSISGQSRSDPARPVSFSNVEQTETWSVGSGLQAAVQWQARPGLWLGASLRSPLRTLVGRGSFLSFSSDQTGELHRVEDQRLRVDHRVPAQLRAGVGYEGARVRAAADVVVSAAQGLHAGVRGRGGATALQPRDLDGNALGTPVVVAEGHALDAVANVNLGVEVALTPRITVLAGAFSDRSSLPREQVDELHPQLDRYGATLGLGRRSARSTTYLGLVGTWASGTAYGVREDGERRWAEAEARALLLTLGGSAELGDDLADAPAARTGPAATASSSAPAPLWRSIWFWSALGAAVAAAATASLWAHRRAAIDDPL